MIIVLEISNPPQWKPGYYRSEITRRIWWLWFAVSFHPMRLDELIELANQNVAVWKDTK